jgi:tetratricopeptide (TPR) repeat protein
MATMPLDVTEDALAARPTTLRAAIRHAALARLAGRLLNFRMAPVLLAAVTFLVFSPALMNGFVIWDDQVNFLQNFGYRGLGWHQIRWMFTSTLMGHYIPVTWLTLGLDYTLWGMHPLGYHLTNNLLHAANAALFYVVALRLLGQATALTGTALRSSSVAAALFFALHPLRVESVAWATERRDVLAGLFFLLSVLMYLSAAQGEGARRRRLLAGSVACYILALLSKSIVMTLPLVLILLDVYPLRRLSLRWGTWRDASTRLLLVEKVPYVVLGLAGAITAYRAVASHHYFTDMAKFGWPGRVTIGAYSLWFYLTKTLLPLSLSPLYELPASMNPLEPRFTVAWIAVVGISAVALALRRRWPAGLAVWVYYGIVVAPVSGVIHAGFQLAHDRYSYVSCLGFALLFGAAVGRVAQLGAAGAVRPSLIRAAAATATAWLLTLGILASQQVQVWRDTDTLWNFAADADPRCSICQGNVGASLARLGLFALAKDRYELALALRPDRIYMHSSLGMTLHRLGDDKAAMSHFATVLAKNADHAGTLTNVGVMLLDQKSYDDAVRYLERALRIDPELVPGLVNLGNALIEIGRPEAALPYLLRARALRPDEAVIHLNLTLAYLALREYEPARREYETLCELDARLTRQIKPMTFHARS